MAERKSESESRARSSETIS
ncbi:hypothetical protein CCACVL1_01730 [Corchorus capsularis]|uniref:Uncharacterized protein n=1 Tax=Corchorus capsularis TaxID=210143 RepID=A0A1R3KG47_COCAP|nr:hypothetical protein CCACVL1_01730 [Corchorus capsularis]